MNNNRLWNLGPAVDNEERCEDWDDAQQFSHPDLHTEENHRDDKEEDGEEEMEDEPVEQEPPEQTLRSETNHIISPPSPLPFVHPDYEKKVDKDSETHPYHHSGHLQPSVVTVCYKNDNVVGFLHVKQLGKTVGISDLRRVKEPDVHGYDEQPTDVVPDGWHLKDSVGNQASDVDNTAQDADHKNPPSREVI